MKSKFLLLPVILAGLLTSCGDNPNPQGEVKVESVSLNASSKELPVGQTFQLTPTITPGNATNKEVTWSTSSSSIATVADGLVTAVNEGVATITVKTKDQEKTATCNFTITKAVEIIHVESVALDITTLTLAVDQSATINATVAPSNATDKSVSWKSSDTSVATVNNGKITGVSAGNATITVTTNDGKKTATCTVTVENEKTISTIAEVRNYIAKNPVDVNTHQCGVNENVKFTIQGCAIAKFDLVKSKKDFGLNVSTPQKVILADKTGYIGCASNPLFDKVAKNQCLPTSRYEVTGYVSIYLGQPELVVTQYIFDKTLDISYDPNNLVDQKVNITNFYTAAQNTIYNCAGHGYGKMVSMEGLTCFARETDGTGIRYFNFTDGTNQIRVNAFNVGDCSEGKAYDFIGLISLKDYSAIVVAISIKQSEAEPVSIDYEHVATEMTIANLKKNKASQDDTDTKYPEYIASWKNIYKVTGYLTTCTQDGKYYLGIRDTYYSGKDVIEGKDKAKTTYNMALIKNNNFWNCTLEEYARYNPYVEYIDQDEAVTFYYIQRLLGYVKGEASWDILLVPESIPELVK